MTSVSVLSYLENQYNGAHSPCVWIVPTEAMQLFVEGNDTLTGGRHGRYDAEDQWQLMN